MKSLQTAARRGGIVTAAALSAMALAACSAGQVTQTSRQVAPVDGSFGGDQATGMSIVDAYIVLDGATGEVSAKFIAANQNQVGEAYALESLTANGHEGQIENLEPIDAGCSLISDSPENVEAMPKDEASCNQYTTISFTNEDFAYAGNVPLVFTFSNLDEPIEVLATVSGPVPEAGETVREYDEGVSSTNQY